MAKTPTSKLVQKLQGPFTAIARAMAQRYDIDIEPSGFECCTDGRVIKIPFNADYLGAGARQVLHGLLDHEVMHIEEESRHKEAGAKTPLQIMTDCRDNREKMMLNVFEDIRGEHRKAQRYPGVADNLRAAALNSVEQFYKTAAKKGFTNFWHTLGCAIITQAQGGDLGWMPAEYKPYLDLVADEVAASTDQSLCNWGDDSHRLACEVIRKVGQKAEQDKKEQEEKESKRGKGEQGEDSEQSSGEGEQDGEGEGDEGEQSGSGQQDGKSEDSSGEGEQDGEGAADGDSGEGSGEGDDDETSEATAALAEGALGDSDTSDLMDGVRREITLKAAGEARASDRYVPHPAALAADRWITPAGSKHQYTMDRAEVQKQIHALKNKFMNIIRTQSFCRQQGDHESGDLDFNELSTVKSGNRRVFTRTAPGRELDTAVSILIDLSGSMGQGNQAGQKAYYAKLTAIALAETFDMLNIPFEIIGFHTPGRHVGHGENYTRKDPMEYHLFKGYKEPFRRVKARLSGITGHDNNVDGEAVMTAALRLAARSEGRKMLFVLSDGQPAGGGASMATLAKHLKEVVKKVTAAGIHVFGIGLKSDAVEKFYNECVVIDDMEALAAEVYKLVSKKIMGRAQQKAS